MPAISELVVRNLALTRGGRRLQSDIGFSVSAGETLSLYGRNGAGKSSLLRAIAGLLDTPRGAIFFRMPPDGIVVDPEERISKVGWLGHQDGVKRQLSLIENLQFHGRYNQGLGNAEEALKLLGLHHVRDIPAQYLSHGQTRRLAFARLLVAPRSLWLLDEPFSAVDAKGKDCMRSQIFNHCNSGGIVVAATHEPLGVEGASYVLE